MAVMSLTIPMLLVAAATYLSPVGAFVVNIPWGITPSQVYAYRVPNPAYKPPTATPKAPTVAPTVAPTTAPTALTMPPPPAKAPPSPVTMAPPPPAPVFTGRRSLLVSKYTYPYRYLVEYSSSAHTYKFKTLKIHSSTKLVFEVALLGAGSTGHHGLARTTSKYRCGHAVKTYFSGVQSRKNQTVKLPKGTYNFFDPTISPVAQRDSKGHLIKYIRKQHNCEDLFISLSVVVS